MSFDVVITSFVSFFFFFFFFRVFLCVCVCVRVCVHMFVFRDGVKLVLWLQLFFIVFTCAHWYQLSWCPFFFLLVPEFVVLVC